jgi:hypothetical protein
MKHIHTQLIGGPYDGGNIRRPDTVPPLGHIWINPGVKEAFGWPECGPARYWRTMSGRYSYNPQVSTHVSI